MDFRTEPLSPLNVAFFKSAAADNAQFSNCYKTEYKDDLVIVEPINSAPYVVDTKGAVSFIFDSKPGSGTDFMRARIRAYLFFTRYAEEMANPRKVA